MTDTDKKIANDMRRALFRFEWFLRHLAQGRVRAAHAALREAHAHLGDRESIKSTMGSRHTTWMEQLEEAMHAMCDDDADRFEVWPHAENLDREFDSGFCCFGAPPIMVWTNRCVYFPVYGAGDSMAMGAAERNPVLEPKLRNSP